MNRSFSSIPSLCAAWILLLHTFVASEAKPPKPPFTIEDLATYTHILNPRLSPDGKWVSYLTLKPLLQENKFDCAMWLQSTNPGSEAQELARFRTTAEQVYLETGELKNFGGQFAWSANSQQLAYTSRLNDKVELRLRDVSGNDSFVAGEFLEAELTGWNDDGSAILFKTTQEEPPPPGPVDPSVLVTDDLSSFGLSWAKKAPATKTQAFEYKLATRKLAEITKEEKKTPEVLPDTYKEAKWPTQAHASKHIIFPIVSPDKKYIMFAGLGQYEQGDVRKAYRDSFIGIKKMGDDSPPREFLHSSDFSEFYQWSSDSKEAYALQWAPEHTTVLAIAPENEEVRELTRTPDRLTDTSWNQDGTSFVAIRQSTFVPDALVKFDLKTKQFSVLSNPNAGFVDKDQPEVRFMRVNNPLGGGIFGRLVLPNGYVKGKRYPLIFTTYRAGTGFLEGAVGEEYPIFPFAANGFVVFAMDTGISNMLSDSGDREFSLLRVKKPLEAMQIVRQQLAEEGVIDPERCGITGLSYGSDIVTYAVATTNIFKAAALPISALDPVLYTLSSVNWQKQLEKFGNPYPDDNGRLTWKKSSLALNAASVATPLLIQSSESEAMLSLETFKALKHYGVPVEWYVYLNEGHVKYQPRSKYLAYQRNLDWMNFWLQDKEDSDPAKRDQYKRWREMGKLQELNQTGPKK